MDFGKFKKTTIYRLLDRHGWRKIVPRSKHVNADREKQEELKKTFPREVEAIFARRDPQDRRPVSPWQVIRKFIYVYAAVCPSFGRMTTLILPFANSEMMTIFLDQVSRDFKQFFIIMLVDRAGWHMSKRLKIHGNIRLVPQPAHSPVVNP